MASYDKVSLKDDLSLIDVATSLGVKMQPGSRSERKILCPSHSDQHFGSCFVREKKWHCYACGAGGDVFNFIMAIQNCTFPDAVKTAAELTGHPDDFLLSDKEASDFLSKVSNCPITPEDLKLIGLSQKVQIPIERALLYRDEDYNGDKFLGVTESPNGEPLVIVGNYETASIYDEYKENPEYFWEMVAYKIKDDIDLRKFLVENIVQTLPLSPEDIYCVSTTLKKEMVQLKAVSKKLPKKYKELIA